jgi:hypothetical protein
MNIDEHLAFIRRECGDEWPKIALRRLLFLVKEDSRFFRSDAEEIRVLLDWAERMIEAGVKATEANSELA